MYFFILDNSIDKIFFSCFPFCSCYSGIIRYPAFSGQGIYKDFKDLKVTNEPNPAVVVLIEAVHAAKFEGYVPAADGRVL